MSSENNLLYKTYSGSDQNSQKVSTNQHADFSSQISQKIGGGSNNYRKGPVWTSTKQSMTYVTTRGIESDTSWQEIEWPKQIMKELVSNAWDWLHDYYPDGTKENREISVRVKTDSILDEGIRRPLIRIAVQNSNPNNIPVFENLNQVFDYTQFHSTKRHQHREVSGALGDFLKRGLGMGYASWTEGYDRERRTSAVASDKQWLEPIIFRHNRLEDRVFIHVKWDEQEYWPIFGDRNSYNVLDFTEVEITLPIDSILKSHGITWILSDLQSYFKRNRIGKSNTEFSFLIERGNL
jgi:hypothetical protein